MDVLTVIFFTCCCVWNVILEGEGMKGYMTSGINSEPSQARWCSPKHIKINGQNQPFGCKISHFTLFVRHERYFTLNTIHFRTSKFSCIIYDQVLTHSQLWHLCNSVPFLPNSMKVDFSFCILIYEGTCQWYTFNYWAVVFRGKFSFTIRSFFWLNLNKLIILLSHRTNVKANLWKMSI